jgi:hypothetical protein
VGPGWGQAGFGWVAHTRKTVKRPAELDRDDWLDAGALSDAGKAIIEQRFRDLEANPYVSVPWKEARLRLILRDHSSVKAGTQFRRCRVHKGCNTSCWHNIREICPGCQISAHLYIVASPWLTSEHQFD